MKTGKLTSKTFVFLETHEAQTINFLLDLGKDIEILAPVRSKGLRTPDIAMDGLSWEIKCPTGHGKRTLDRLLKNAMRQSKNIIFDLRKTSIPDIQCLSKLQKEFTRRTDIKRFLIITKQQTMLDLSKTEKNTLDIKK